MRKTLSFALIPLAGMLVNFSCAGALEWHPDKGFKWAELAVPQAGRPGFTLLPPEQTGITFTNPLDERALAANRNLANGSGVAMGDVDHDGLDDIFFCSLDGHNALYKNLGRMKFKDVTAGSGIVCTNRICRGAVFADINGDGWLDLLISTTGNGVLCFTNKGNGAFAECSQSAGTSSPYGATTLALADIDGNGTLDLYVADYRVESSRDRAEFDKIDIQNVNGRPTLAPALRDRFYLADGHIQEYGEPDLVYLNDGKGHFTPLSWTNGAFLDEHGSPLASPPQDWGLTAAFRDLNGDGAPDIYVCNDYWTPDRLWLNDGKGHFQACPSLALRHTSASSMGVDFADVDRDGQVDFCVVDMLARDWEHRKREVELFSGLMRGPSGMLDERAQISRNVLFRNRGDGTFEEIGPYAGITASGWSWQSVFLDVDLDGYEDILIPTGYFHDINDMDANVKAIKLRRAGRLAPPKPGPDGQPVPRSAQELKEEELYQQNILAEPLKTPVVAFRNLGNLKFEDSGPAWGLDQPGLANAIAIGDLDNDGGLDFVVNNLGSAAGVYHNHGPAPRVAVRLKGLAPNTQAIGAKIKLLGGAVPLQSQEVASGGLYLSGSDPERVFAAGRSGNMSLEVTWRNGRQSVVREVKPNRIYEIDEAGAADAAKPPVEVTKPFFKDVSQMISNRHHHEFYDDYVRQPLLPYQLSQEGPGVAWINLLNDQREELVIGSGRGGQLGIYAPDGKGGLTRLPAASRLPEDLTGIVGWVRGANERVLVVGRDNYESASNQPSASAVSLGPTHWQQDLPETKASTGPLAVADVYGDGKLELFVGGRVIPGRYPEPADSRIYRNAGGQLVLDEENSRVLEKVGLVNGAVWSDLDGDGYPELILACEWGPIRVFKNQAGQLHEITKELGLERYTGWWHGVTTGDLDGDGRLDIIASNWGENSDYEASSNHPARLYYGDFTDRGALDIIEVVYDPLRQTDVPRRMRTALANAFPALIGRFPTYKTFAEATMEQILGILPKPAGKVEAQTMASTVFFNRTNHFEAVEMPYAAQIAPAFAASVGDFDGDGNEDIFLSQNFITLVAGMLQPDDAGRGLWLRGNGGGRLEAIPGQKSGILAYGEQRGAALGDFDGDGRVDLVVTQNGAETKLYQNVLGKPGLRVRLNGPPGNPDGVGATLRLVFGNRWGAAREIHGGSGYWSQDSAVQVMGCPEAPTRIWVRWPGGKTTTNIIPAGAREIAVDTDGQLTVR